MSRNVHSQARGDAAAGLALLGLIAAVAGVLVLVPAGGAAAGVWNAGQWAWPAHGTFWATMAHLVRHPATPAQAYAASVRPAIPGHLGYWATVVAAECLFLLVVTVLVVLIVARRGEYGMLTRRRLKKAMRGGRNTLLSPIGHYLGVKVRLRDNDAGLVIAPQQSGKTARFAVQRIKDALGAVVATGTKVDLVFLTMFTRYNPDDPADDRTVAIFDPDQISGYASVQWDIVDGCQVPREAETRAAAMIAAAPETNGTGGNIQFFKGQATTVLKCLLHAAAIQGLSMREVMRWADNFADPKPLEILTSNPAAVPSWHIELKNATQSEAAETVGSTSLTLSGALKSLSNPEVMALVCPPPGAGFNVQAFIERTKDTLYVLSEGGDDVSTAPLVTAFVASVERAGRRYSQHQKGGRITPGLTFVLDEAANVPLPRLGTMLSDGGGRGMQTWAILQSFGQGRKRWGRDGWEGMWGSTTLKLILPGCAETSDLENVSKLVGNRRVREEGSLIPTGNEPVRYRVEPVMPPDAIQQMDDGTALMILKNVGNAVIHLPGWWERADSKDFAASLARAERDTGHLSDPPRPGRVTALATRLLTRSGR